MARQAPPRRSVALVSGGVDSAALVAHLLSRGDRVLPLFVRSGFRWERAELHWLRRLLAAMEAPRLEPLGVLDGSDEPVIGGRHWAFRGSVPDARSADAAVYLPGRNLLLATKAAIYGSLRGADAVALGVLAGNPFPDATPGFLRRLSGALSAGLARTMAVEAPFRRLTKSQVLARHPGLPLSLTFSCLSPRGLRPCGGCNKCEERRRVLVG